MNTQFKKGIIEVCILKIVSREEMYGFEIIDQLSGLLSVNDNTIYPILRRLTHQGYFSIYEKKSPLGAKRKYYSITKEGQAKLDESLNELSSFISSVYQILRKED